MIYISGTYHSDVIEWNHFPRYWPFVRGIHRSPVNSPHKGQWRGALMFYLIYAPINGWVNTEEAGDLRRHRAHYDVIVMILAKKKNTKHLLTHLDVSPKVPTYIQFCIMMILRRHLGYGHKSHHQVYLNLSNTALLRSKLINNWTHIIDVLLCHSVFAKSTSSPLMIIW